MPSLLPFPLSVRGSFIGIKVISGRACEEERICSFSSDVGKNNTEAGKTDEQMGSDIKDL